MKLPKLKKFKLPKSSCKPCMGTAIKAAIIAAQPEAAPVVMMFPNCPNTTGIKACVGGIVPVDFRSGNPHPAKDTPKKCKVVDQFVHCQIKDKSAFDRQSFRTISPNDDVRITIGCPKGNWTGKKCKVSTQAQRIMYRKEACGEYEGCKIK
jgi:hypothetical protein